MSLNSFYLISHCDFGEDRQESPIMIENLKEDLQAFKFWIGYLFHSNHFEAESAANFLRLCFHTLINWTL